MKLQNGVDPAMVGIDLTMSDDEEDLSEDEL